MPKIWIRVGDAGDDESFDSLDEVISCLNDLKVGKVTCWYHFAFDTTNYRGDDYISIYHGNRAGCPTHTLTAAEEAALDAGLKVC